MCARDVRRVVVVDGVDAAGGVALSVAEVAGFIHVDPETKRNKMETKRKQNGKRLRNHVPKGVQMQAESKNR